MFKKYIQELEDKQEVYLRLKIRPNAVRTELKEIMADDTIKINVSAPAVKGKANQELIKFLAREFAVSKKNIKIIAGAGEKTKLIKIVK